MAGTTFKKPALSIASVIASLFRPKYAEQNQTKWVKNLLADDGLFTQDDGALVGQYLAWTATGATLLVDTNQLEVTLTGTAGGAYQDVITEIGKTYTINCDAKIDTCDSVLLRAFDDGWTTLIDEIETTSSTLIGISITFKAIGPSTRIYARAEGISTEIGYFDNISIRESMPEKVQNGTFDSDTSGWEPIDAQAILSVDTGRLKITNDDTSQAAAYQAIATEIGKTYILTLNGTDGDSTGQYRVGTTIGGIDVVASTLITSGGIDTITFEAIDTLLYIFFNVQSSVSAEYCYFDNISVKEISYELPHNAEVQAVYSDGSRQTPVDAYNVFDDGFNKTVNFTDDAVLTTDIAIDYRNKL